MYTKKALAKNRKVWLKPNFKFNKKPPVKTGGNWFDIEGIKIRVFIVTKLRIPFKSK